jgi:predicted RNA-binding protein
MDVASREGTRKIMIWRNFKKKQKKTSLLTSSKRFSSEFPKKGEKSIPFYNNLLVVFSSPNCGVARSQITGD